MEVTTSKLYVRHTTLGIPPLIVWEGCRLTIKSPSPIPGPYFSGIWRLTTITESPGTSYPPLVTLQWLPSLKGTSRRSPITRTADWFDKVSLRYTRLPEGGYPIPDRNAPLIEWRTAEAEIPEVPSAEVPLEPLRTPSGKPILSTWTIPSRRNPTSIYTVVLYPEREFSCDCPGWINSKSPKKCRHTIVFSALLNPDVPPSSLGPFETSAKTSVEAQSVPSLGVTRRITFRD